jgi:hypothetical protein
MVFKIFQNCFPLYQWDYTIFYVKQNHLTKHFNKYNESIIIWYGLWHWVFGTSKIQYVMVTQIYSCNSYNMIISHIIFFLSFFSHIIHLYFVTWPMIDNPTSCGRIMYFALKCFHLSSVPQIVLNRP